MSGALDLGTSELAASRAKLLDELIFVPQTHGDQFFYHVEAPSRSRFFRIGYPEYVFLSLLDGSVTFAQAVTLTARALGADALNQAQALHAYSWALENNLLRLVDPAHRHAPVKPRPHGWRDLLARLNPLWIKIPLCQPDRFLSGLSRWLGWIFSIPATWLGLSLVLIAGMIVITKWDRFCRDSQFILSAGNWLWLGAAWVVLKLLHELAHGLAAKRYQGTPGDMGVLLAFLAPTAYIDVTSCWRFASKWQRIHVAAAGMFIEMMMAAVAVLAWSQTESPETGHLLRDIIVMASITTIVFNLNPLMRLDGYYMLSDFLEIPNLATEGQRRFTERLQWLFFGQSAGTPCMRGWRGIFIEVYGFLAAAWRMMVCASLLLAASVLARGAGIALCAVAIVCWFAWPAWQRLVWLSQQFLESPSRVVRACLVAAAMAGFCGVAWVWLPFPGVVSAPGVVDYQDAGIVRSRTAGFVQAVHVHDGQFVEPGTLLLELRNESLDFELRSMESQIRQSDIQRRIAQEQGHTGESQVLERNRRASEERLAELQRRQAGLQVRAQSSGLAVARNLNQLLGRYVQEGQPLLAIGSHTDKELVLAIPQDQLEEAAKQLGQPIRFRIGTRVARPGILHRIEPRATRELPHPALGAESGGPLAVTETLHPDGSRQTRLVEPRFRAVVKLDAENGYGLFCGEQGHAILGRNQHAFGKQVWWLCTQWIRGCVPNAL